MVHDGHVHSIVGVGAIKAAGSGEAGWLDGAMSTVGASEEDPACSDGAASKFVLPGSCRDRKIGKIVSGCSPAAASKKGGSLEGRSFNEKSSNRNQGVSRS